MKILVLFIMILAVGCTENRYPIEELKKDLPPRYESLADSDITEITSLREYKEVLVRYPKDKEIFKKQAIFYTESIRNMAINFQSMDGFANSLNRFTVSLDCIFHYWLSETPEVREKYQDNVPPIYLEMSDLRTDFLKKLGRIAKNTEDLKIQSRLADRLAAFSMTSSPMESYDKCRVIFSKDLSAIRKDIDAHDPSGFKSWKKRVK